MSTGISVWAATAASDLADVTTQPLHTCTLQDFTFEVVSLDDGIWMVSKKNIKGKSLSFKILGDRRLSCRLCIINTRQGKLPSFKVMAGEDKEQQPIKGNGIKKGTASFEINGDQIITISWNNK